MQPEPIAEDDAPARGAAGRPGSALDLAALAATPLCRDPFDHVVVPGFLKPAVLPAIERDFPRIREGGSFPADGLACGPAFRALLAELQGAEVAAAFGTKFGLELGRRPTMVTLRGRARAKDGRIHTDSASKLVTALIYLNSGWEAEGGRLRLLRGPDDLDDYAAEVPPDAGTLLAFRCTANAYHGHKPFVGERRSIQLNWVTDASVVRRELRRHGLSAWSKRLLRLVRPKER